MLPYGCIGSNWDAGIIFLDQGVQQVTHAMELLQFERRFAVFGRFNDMGHRARIVRRELTIDSIASQQNMHAGLIREVGMRFIRKHGVVFQAELLCDLNLSIPVSSLNEPHHEARRTYIRQLYKPSCHRSRALLVGLKYKT